MGNVRRKGGDRNKSVCEKSMQMVMSIARLSALSLARMSLGSAVTAPPAVAKVRAAGQPVAKFPGSGRQSSQESDTTTRITYLVEAVRSEKQGVLQEKCVDEMATEYIRRVRERNRFEAAKLYQGILPPPPAPHVLR